MTHAKDERRALCELLAQTGPDRPTLCTGWQTGDLAAHLVIRERRPDAAAGVAGGPVAGHARRVQAKLSQRISFSLMVELIKTGPPRFSAFGLPGADERLNLVEYFIHHEDVRRAQPDWQPRKLSPELTDELWGRMGLAKLMLRKAPIGIELVRSDAGDESRPPGDRRVRMTVKARTPVVTVTGDPAELTLWVSGRDEAARVELGGADADVALLRAWRASTR